jgi:hypothetical protein
LGALGGLEGRLAVMEAPEGTVKAVFGVRLAAKKDAGEMMIR